MTEHSGEIVDPDVYVPRTEYRLLCERSERLRLLTEAMTAECGIVTAEHHPAGEKVERRVIVRGWKYDPDDPKNHFVSVHAFMSDDGIAAQRARIGEKGLPDWQPHITAVKVEERTVTPWVRVPDAACSHEWAWPKSVGTTGLPPNSAVAVCRHFGKRGVADSGSRNGAT